MDLYTTSVPANFTQVAPHENQNRTEDSGCYFDEDHVIFTMAPVYILIIGVVGIVLNVFVLMVFCFHKKPCTVPEIFLSNLAAADLTLVCSLPISAINLMKRSHWTFGKTLCKLTNVCVSMNIYCSVYFLVLISIDRYLALVHPLSHDKIRSPFYAKAACLLVWILGFLLSLPTLIYRNVTFDPQSNITHCILDFDFIAYQRFEVMFIMLSFIIPIFIISFCTFKIIKALSNRLIEGLNSQRKEQRATTLVLAVLAAFLICWVPYDVFRILDLLKDSGFLKSCQVRINLFICDKIFTYFAYFNSVLNPILYVIVGNNFRHKARELFKQWSHKRTETFSLTSTRTNLSRTTKTQNSTT